MSEIEHYMKAVSRLRAALAAANEELIVIADDALDGATAERIDSVRAGIKDALEVAPGA